MSGSPVVFEPGGVGHDITAVCPRNPVIQTKRTGSEARSAIAAGREEVCVDAFLHLAVMIFPYSAFRDSGGR